MIVDADVHVSASKRGSIDITIEDLIRLMDKNKVDKAICWPMLTYTRQVSEDNKAIGEGMKTYPDRIIGFGGLNPRLGPKETLNELKKCVEKYGFKGFKMNGARDNYVIDDKSFTYPIIEKLSEEGVVLALHSGVNDPGGTHPWRIGNIAKDFPKLKILMVHMGGAGVPGLHDAAIKMGEEYPNIFLLGSEVFQFRAITEAIKKLGADRVCYGSDAPFSPMKVTLAIYGAVLEDFSEEEKKSVMGENILHKVLN